MGENRNLILVFLIPTMFASFIAPLNSECIEGPHDELFNTILPEPSSE